MIEINLLPKEMRKARGMGIPKSVFVGAAVVVGVMMLLAIITGFQVYRLRNIDDQIAEVRRQADRMRDDIILVDRLVDVKTKVLARLSAINKLDLDRERWVSILEELSNRVPDFLWLTAFKPAEAAGKTKRGGIRTPSAKIPVDSATTGSPQLAIEGYSFTLNGLANFLIELNASEYFDEIKLDYAKMTKVDDQRVFNFSLHCSLQDPMGAEQMQDVENAGSDKESAVGITDGVAALLGDGRVWKAGK